MRLPAARPDSYSGCPTWAATPSPAKTSDPEFKDTTGMPAATADLIESPRASASGIEMARPSGWLATAESISWPIWIMSNVSGARYSTVTPRSFAAASKPFLTIDQNGSAAWPWVTATIRMAS